MSVFKCLMNSSKDEVREMMIASANYNAIVQEEEILQQPKNRKRRGSLNGLSLEEKILRKKLKNREAAQNSRDKKKAYVTNLESALTVLQKENSKLSKQVLQLLEENKKLKDHNEKVEQELLKLRCKENKFEGKENLEQGLLDVSVAKGDIRSAVPIPQQKDHLPLLALSQVIWILCLTLMTSSGLMKHVTLWTLMNCQNLLIPLQKRLWNLRKRIKHKKWWGPWQRSWNPLGTVVL